MSVCGKELVSRGGISFMCHGGVRQSILCLNKATLNTLVSMLHMDMVRGFSSVEELENIRCNVITAKSVATDSQDCL